MIEFLYYISQDVLSSRQLAFIILLTVPYSYPIILPSGHGKALIDCSQSSADHFK